MEQFETWRDAITASLQDVFNTVVSYLPNLLAALIVLVVGIVIAASLGTVLEKLIAFTKVDQAIDKLGVNKILKGLGKLKVSAIIGWLVKWFLIVVVLMAVADILKLTQLIDFLEDVANFLPKVVVAIAILLIGFIGGNFVHQTVYRAVAAAKIHSPNLLASLAKWAIVIFAFIAGLTQLKIAEFPINTLFTGIIAMFALAGGLAFGLGGRNKAEEWLNDLKKKL